jgi:hypothetical protein
VGGLDGVIEEGGEEGTSREEEVDSFHFPQQIGDQTHFALQRK